MSEWKEYTGSDEQIREMLFAANKHGVMIIHHNGELCCEPFMDAGELEQHLDKRTKYPIKMFLLCHPHPCADLIKIWADTGCQVWIKANNFRDLLHIVGTLKDIQDGNVLKTTKPDWNIPGAEYSLTPFED